MDQSTIYYVSLSGLSEHNVENCGHTKKNIYIYIYVPLTICHGRKIGVGSAVFQGVSPPTRHAEQTHADWPSTEVVALPTLGNKPLGRIGDGSD